MDKKQRILQAATQLFANEGVAVPTSRLAKAAGVSNGTLFNYFETKQALIDELYYSTKASVLDDLLGISELQNLRFKDMIHTLWRYYVHWAIANPATFKVIDMLSTAELISEEALDATDKLFEFFFEAMAQGQQRGEIQAAPIELMCELGQGQLKALVHYAQKQQLQAHELETTIDTAFSLHWQGISSNPFEN